MRRLDISPQCLVAGPALLAGRSIASPADLNDLPSLTLGPPRREYQWELEHAGGGTAHVAHAPRLVTDDMTALCDAAVGGVGVVALPTMMVWPHVQAGRLVQLLPDWRPPAGVVHAVFPSRRGLLPSVRTLLDVLVAECAEARKRTVL